MLIKPKTFSLNQIRFRYLNVGDCLRFDSNPLRLWFFTIGHLYEITAIDKDQCKLEIVTNLDKQINIYFEKPIWQTTYYASDMFTPIFIKRT